MARCQWCRASRCHSRRSLAEDCRHGHGELLVILPTTRPLASNCSQWRPRCRESGMVVHPWEIVRLLRAWERSDSW